MQRQREMRNDLDPSRPNTAAIAARHGLPEFIQQYGLPLRVDQLPISCTFTQGVENLHALHSKKE